MSDAIQLKPPTEAQNASYLRCLQIQARRFDERRLGRSGYLPAELEAESQHHHGVVEAALDEGVGFDRMAFGDVEAA